MNDLAGQVMEDIYNEVLINNAIINRKEDNLNKLKEIKKLSKINRVSLKIKMD